MDNHWNYEVVEIIVKNIMIGKGEVYWKDQITALKKDNYSGYYVVEPHFGHRIHSTYEHIESFKKIYSEA